jgi:hypothetical protein
LLRTTDPKAVAEMIGATNDVAEKFGFVHREPVRW